MIIYEKYRRIIYSKLPTLDGRSVGGGVYRKKAIGFQLWVVGVEEEDIEKVFIPAQVAGVKRALFGRKPHSRIDSRLIKHKAMIGEYIHKDVRSVDYLASFTGGERRASIFIDFIERCGYWPYG